MRHGIVDVWAALASDIPLEGLASGLSDGKEVLDSNRLGFSSTTSQVEKADRTR